MTVIDNSNVQLSDLNRHNFTMEDIGHSKAEAVGRRLLSINPDADIRIVNQIINKDNAATLLEGHTVAVNAIDITTESRSYILTTSDTPHSSWSSSPASRGSSPSRRMT